MHEGAKRAEKQLGVLSRDLMPMRARAIVGDEHWNFEKWQLRSELQVLAQYVHC